MNGLESEATDGVTDVHDSTGMAAIDQAVKRWYEKGRQTLEEQVGLASDALGRATEALAEARASVQAAEQKLADLSVQQDALLTDRVQRHQAGIFETLRADANRLRERTTLLLEAEALRRERYQALVDANPEIEALQREVAEAESVDVSALPPSYREAILAHHKAQAAKLDAMRQTIDVGPLVVDAPWLTLECAWAVRAAATGAELHLALPVDKAALDVPEPGGVDVALHVAARLAEAMMRHAALSHREVPAVRVTVEQDLLLLAVSLQGTEVDGFADRAADIIDTAEELSDAKVTLSFYKMEPTFFQRDLRTTSHDDDRLDTDEIVLEVEDD